MEKSHDDGHRAAHRYLDSGPEDPSARQRRTGQHRVGAVHGRRRDRRHPHPRRRCGAGVLREVRQVLCRQLPAHTREDRRDHRACSAPSPRRHRVRPGTGPGNGTQAARVAERLRDRDSSRRLPGPEERSGPGRRCLHPRWQVSAAGQRPHDDRDGEGRRSRAGGGMHAPDSRRGSRRHDRRHAPGGCRRDLSAGRHPGGGSHGHRHRDHPPRQHARRTRQRVRRGSQAAVVRRGWGSICSPDRRKC
jgi:hypothetical protein